MIEYNKLIEYLDEHEILCEIETRYTMLTIQQIVLIKLKSWNELVVTCNDSFTHENEDFATIIYDRLYDKFSHLKKNQSLEQVIGDIERLCL